MTKELMLENERDYFEKIVEQMHGIAEVRGERIAKLEDELRKSKLTPGSYHLQAPPLTYCGMTFEQILKIKAYYNEKTGLSPEKI